MTTQDDRAKAAREHRGRSYIDPRLWARDACLGSSRDVWGRWTTDPGGKNGPGRRRAGRFVQSGRTAFFPVPVRRASTSGRTVSFFPELNEPARRRLRQHLLRRLHPRNILGEALFEDGHGCLKDGAISLDSWLAAFKLGTRTAATFSRKSSMDMVSAFPVDGRPLLARWILASLR